ncbi:MAG TPA: PQQ-binding-like beta-propeller repeat protein [Pyrinomonadaceae bacterium]|nr:PQQ-binding-like beta-propeller repeat protein [Pyrinomonadaceae bacterium]
MKTANTFVLAGLLFAVSIAGIAQIKVPVESSKPLAGSFLSRPLTVGWRFNSDLTLNLTPAFSADRVYLPLAGGIITSLRAKDGSLIWRSEFGGELSASPVADERNVYVASETGKVEAGARRATGALRALGSEGGVTHWMRTLATPLQGALTLADGRLFAGGRDGKFYSFDASTGELRWAFAYSAAFNSQPVVDGARVYAGAEDGYLVVLDKQTGKLLWRFRTRGPIRGPAAIRDDIVFFGSGDNYVYAVNAMNGRLLWRNRTGAGVEAVVRAGEDLLVASLDNFVYKFSLNGKRLWKRQMPGRISAQPFITDAEALFTPLTSIAGVVLELRDGRQVNSLPIGEEITTSASPIAIGEVVLLTTEHGLLAFSQPREVAPLKQN